MRLLLAEDEGELSNALSVILRHNHYSVDVVDNGADALDYALAGQYDGLILDILMPGLDGIQVLKKLRESRGLSQAELAKISGVGLRSIQMYEQRVNDIDKAQAQTIYKLSRVIGCSMEDLLEKPME